eukprot:3048949-Amphidinium_carterae.1
MTGHWLALRHQLPRGWGVAKTWRLLTPIQNHKPLPLTVLQAMITVALSWGWFEFGLALGLGFFGLLRPSELLHLRAHQILLPSVTLDLKSACFWYWVARRLHQWGPNINTGVRHGVTPASLRPCGATYFFQETQSFELVRWRGRWLASRTLEIYLQETGVVTLMSDLAPTTRQRIHALAMVASLSIVLACQHL